MKGRNWIGFGALLLVAAIFFLSLMCPPASERTPTTTDPGAAPPPEAGRYAGDASTPEPAQRETTSASLQHDDLLVRVTDAAGLPILGAEIFLNWADKASGAAAKRGISDARGEWRAERLPHARYRAHAVAEGFFPSAQQVEFAVPAAAPTEIVLPLERGARLEGFVFGLDGAEAPHAWLRFRQLDDGTTILRQADLRGAFSSGPLRGGAWEVAWVEHAAAEPDPRIRWSTVDRKSVV